MEFFSTRLKQLRKDRNMKQEQVARLVGVNKSAISAYENDLRKPSYRVLVRLSNLYGVSTDYLLGKINSRSVDVSGLSERDIEIVCRLIAEMANIL
ncbi:MAG: helix-turn-helix transcriptional regulator [Clostridia bacterium]|nr:helix-turn-helix transcriptional regulator [Clostridia bacterium]